MPRTDYRVKEAHNEVIGDVLTFGTPLSAPEDAEAKALRAL
jgi:hypothetical protein